MYKKSKFIYFGHDKIKFRKIQNLEGKTSRLMKNLNETSKRYKMLIKGLNSMKFGVCLHGLTVYIMGMNIVMQRVNLFDHIY